MYAHIQNALFSFVDLCEFAFALVYAYVSVCIIVVCVLLKVSGLPCVRGLETDSSLVGQDVATDHRESALHVMQAVPVGRTVWSVVVIILGNVSRCVLRVLEMCRGGLCLVEMMTCWNDD